MIANPLIRIPLWSVFGCVALVILLAALNWAMFLDLPGSSPTFDCDDATLAMYERFSRLGISTTPIVGSLKTTGEKYEEITHIWLLVNIAGTKIAFDWGTPYFDAQHYEGYAVTYERLLQFVAQDLTGTGAGQETVATGP